MLDDLNYANKYILKVNRYIREGIMPGERILITQETQEIPLDIGTVEILIKHNFEN